jgi:hypothetical protein
MNWSIVVVYYNVIHPTPLSPFPTPNKTTPPYGPYPFLMTQHLPSFPPLPPGSDAAQRRGTTADCTTPILGQELRQKVAKSCGRRWPGAAVAGVGAALHDVDATPAPPSLSSKRQRGRESVAQWVWERVRGWGGGCGRAGRRWCTRSIDSDGSFPNARRDEVQRLDALVESTSRLETKSSFSCSFCIKFAATSAKHIKWEGNK